MKGVWFVFCQLLIKINTCTYVYQLILIICTVHQHLARLLLCMQILKLFGHLQHLSSAFCRLRIVTFRLQLAFLAVFKLLLPFSSFKHIFMNLCTFLPRHISLTLNVKPKVNKELQHKQKWSSVSRNMGSLSSLCSCLSYYRTPRGSSAGCARFSLRLLICMFAYVWLKNRNWFIIAFDLLSCSPWADTRWVHSWRSDSAAGV